MHLRRLTSLVAVPAGALLASVALAGCGAQADAAPAPAAAPAADVAPIRVIASFYPLQFVAQEVGGDLVAVDNLTPPGGDPHFVELSPARTRDVGEADVVVTLGGFIAAVDDAIAQRDPEIVVDAADIVQLMPASVTGGHAHDDESSEHAHEGYSHDEEPDDDHAHAYDTGGYDPHFWLDPVLLAELAVPVADALSQVDPANAEVFAANAADLVERLHELDAQFAEALAPFAGATMITNHTAFGYLAHRYGLNQVGITGLDHHIEPSPARMREIAEMARHYGVSTLFYETLVSPRVVQALANDLGINAVVIDTLEGLTPAGIEAGDDYITIMLRNLDVLVEGLTVNS